MAMDKTILGTLINTKLSTLSESEKRNSNKVWEAVADAIISHIKENAELASLPVSGITISPGAVLTQGSTTGGTGKIS